MKKEKKIKLSKFTIAKIDNLQLKGGVASNACASEACITDDCTSIITTCRTTLGSRTSDSL